MSSSLITLTIKSGEFRNDTFTTKLLSTTTRKELYQKVEGRFEANLQGLTRGQHQSMLSLGYKPNKCLIFNGECLPRDNTAIGYLDKKTILYQFVPLTLHFKHGNKSFTNTTLTKKHTVESLYTLVKSNWKDINRSGNGRLQFMRWDNIEIYLYDKNRTLEDYGVTDNAQITFLLIPDIETYFCFYHNNNLYQIHFDIPISLLFADLKLFAGRENVSIFPSHHRPKLLQYMNNSNMLLKHNGNTLTEIDNNFTLFHYLTESEKPEIPFSKRNFPFLYIVPNDVSIEDITFTVENMAGDALTMTLSNKKSVYHVKLEYIAATKFDGNQKQAEVWMKENKGDVTLFHPDKSAEELADNVLLFYSIKNDDVLKVFINIKPNESEVILKVYGTTAPTSIYSLSNIVPKDIPAYYGSSIEDVRIFIKDKFKLQGNISMKVHGTDIELVDMNEIGAEKDLQDYEDHFQAPNGNTPHTFAITVSRISGGRRFQSKHHTRKHHKRSKRTQRKR